MPEISQVMCGDIVQAVIFLHTQVMVENYRKTAGIEKCVKTQMILPFIIMISENIITEFI